MDSGVFEFQSYKEYLRHLENEGRVTRRGFRSRLAEVLDCQNAYISQVLNGNAHLSLEQAIAVAEFLQLTKSETDFFLLLIQHARAGSQKLRVYLEDQIRTHVEEHLLLQNRVGRSTTLAGEAQAVYYSSWHYSAIHMLATIPKYQQVDQLIAAINLPKQVVMEAVEFLCECGLAIRERDKIKPGPTLLHLGKDSPNLLKHHSNWRLAAIQSMALNDSTAIHYSTVSSLSVKDCEILRSQIVAMIQEYVETVKVSKEETLVAFGVDFFGLLNISPAATSVSKSIRSK